MQRALHNRHVLKNPDNAAMRNLYRNQQLQQ